MYGPDTLQGRMFDRVGASNVRGPALLSGYQLIFDKPNMKNKREGLPNIHEQDGKDVFGLIFDLSDRQLEILDGFFGGYEQQRIRAQLLPPAIDSEEVTPSDASTSVTALTWVARRTGRNLQPSYANMVATHQGLEQNLAPEEFVSSLKEFEPLPSEIIEIMVRFIRGMSEEDARTIMLAAGSTIRRRMRTDHKDEVQLLVQLPRAKADQIIIQLEAMPQVTLVEKNSGGFGILS